MKNIILILITLFCVNSIAQQQEITKIEYDGVYFEVAQNKYIEAIEAKSQKVVFFHCSGSWGNGMWPNRNTPKAQISLTQYRGGKPEDFIEVKNISKIILKGIDLINPKYTIGLSKSVTVPQSYILDLNLNQLIDYKDNKWILTPEYCYGGDMDSVKYKKTIAVKRKTNVKTNTTELLVTEPLVKNKYYVVWVWCEDGSLPNKLWFLKIIE